MSTAIVPTGLAKNKALVRAKRELPFRQRLLLYALATNAGVNAALRALDAAGTHIPRTTAFQWKKLPKFKKALQLLEADIADQVTKSGVVNNAAALLEEAMTARPILYQGQDTGYNEVNLGAALKANEQLAKAVRAWNDDDSGRTVVNINLDFMTPQYDDRGEQKLRDVDPYSEAIDGEYEEVAEDDDSWLR